MVPLQCKATKKVIDSMESLWDTKITTKNKNPKGMGESKFPIFGFNHIAHAIMGLGLMYFIWHKCFPASKSMELVKGDLEPSERVVRNLQGKAILNLVLKALVATFNPPFPYDIPISLNWDIMPSTPMRINILSWMNKNFSTNFIEVPNTEVLLSYFSLHL